MCPIFIVYVAWKWLLAQESLALWLEGLALVAIFGLELKEYRRQGAERIEQHRESVAQMEVWQSLAKATRDSADAANKNIEIVISKERARLKIDLQDLSLAFDDDLKIYAIKFTVNIFGTSPAFITETTCAAFVVTADWIDDEDAAAALMMPLHYVPNIIPPNNPPIEEFAIFESNFGAVNEAIMNEIRLDKLFVGIRGFIKYKDVFDRDRITSFRYVWKYSSLKPPEGSERWGAWHKCGKEEENRET